MLSDCAAIMSCRRLSTVITLVVLIGLFAETVANLRMIGWDFQSGSQLHPFGSRLGTKKRFARFYCWAQDANRECSVNLYFSEDASQPYYQIIGGVTEYYDKRSSTYCKDMKWGNTGSGTKLSLMNGWVWNSCTNDWGYGYTSLYVRKTTTDSPFLQGTAYQRFEAGRGEKLRMVVTAGTTTGAVHHEIVAYQAPSDQWSSATEAIYLYISPTIITEYKPLFDQKTERKISDSAMKSRVIVNDGCGKEFVKGMTGQITNKETLELSSTARWQKTFDFGLTQEFTISGAVGVVSISSTTTLAFKWSSTNEMTKSKTKTTESTYVWPYHCTPGYQCKYSIFKKVSQITIPVKFTFKRGDSTFTEMNTLVTTAETWHEEKHVTKLATRSCRRK